MGLTGNNEAIDYNSIPHTHICILKVKGIKTLTDPFRHVSQRLGEGREGLEGVVGGLVRGRGGGLEAEIEWGVVV